VEELEAEFAEWEGASDREMQQFENSLSDRLPTPSRHFPDITSYWGVSKIRY
jgi:hypothetical protein